MARTLKMDQKEIREARRVGIPESIIGKIGQGIEPSEKEKNIINKYGKEYVSVHSRNGNRIRPHLRDLPGGGRSKLTSPSQIKWLKKYYVVEGKSFHAGSTYEPLAFFTTKEEAIRERDKLMNIYPSDLSKGLRTRYRYRNLVRRDEQLLEWMEQDRD